MSNKAIAAVQRGEDAIPEGETLDPRLAAIPGLDAEKGLQHVRGRVESYMKLLRTFAQTRAGDEEAMRAHLAARNYVQLSAVTHNIQGVAGFLGAVRICSLATEIANAHRRGCDGEEIAPLAHALIESQAEFAAAVQALLGDSPLAKP